MYDVDVNARVRRAVLVEGRSRRAVAREFGLARKTVRKMLAYSLSPGYDTGGDTIVKDYVRQAKLSRQEMFIPLAHAPGEAKADFGEAQVVIAGVEHKAHFMAFDLPHSDDCYVQALPAETTAAFLEGQVRAFGVGLVLVIDYLQNYKRRRAAWKRREQRLNNG
jgi:transposase